MHGATMKFKLRFSYKTNQLMLYGEIVAYCSEIHTINTRERHTVEYSSEMLGTTNIKIP